MPSPLQMRKRPSLTMGDTSGTCQKGISQNLDHSHDYVCLNFGSNLAAAMSVISLPAAHFVS